MGKRGVAGRGQWPAFGRGISLGQGGGGLGRMVGSTRGIFGGGGGKRMVVLEKLETVRRAVQTE